MIPGYIKERSAHLILRKFLELSEHCQTQVSLLPIVPVEMPSSSKETLYCSIVELLDPTATEIESLLFSDELMYPKSSLFDQFRGVMIQCGLRSKLTWTFMMERIRCFALTERPLEEVAIRVQRLLQLPAACDHQTDTLERQEARDLNWITAKASGASIIRVDAGMCRSSEYQLLVGRVLLTLDYEVHITWRELLGWNSPLPVSTIVLQLERGIADMDLDVVVAVLKYIKKSGQQSAYVDSLRHMDCILSSSGRFLPPQRIFLTGSAGLRPYLDDVDVGFLNQHHSLLISLDVCPTPSLADLFQVQTLLAAMEQPLDTQNIGVAIEIVRLASSHDREKLSELKAPDQAGRLQDLSDLVFWDLDFSTSSATLPLIHPGVPREAVERLGIQPFSEKILMGEIGLDDQEDEDEFLQREEVTTGIADTLERYPITATFNEYLANAEDSGTAKQVDWLLDECLDGDYPSSTLLSRELAGFQGPALFMHNDGGTKENPLIISAS
jgi:sacsin